MVDRRSRAGSGSSWTGWYLESPGLDPAGLVRLEGVPDGILKLPGKIREFFAPASGAPDTTSSCSKPDRKRLDPMRELSQGFPGRRVNFI